MSSTELKSKKSCPDKLKMGNVDRQMLDELKIVLELFETVTDEWQSDSVSISKVYPCVSSLKVRLHENTGV